MKSSFGLALIVASSLIAASIIAARTLTPSEKNATATTASTLAATSAARPVALDAVPAPLGATERPDFSVRTVNILAEAATFEKRFNEFAAEFGLNDEERQRFLVVLYDAQEAQKEAPLGNLDLDTDVYANIRGDAATQYVLDVSEILGSDRLDRVFASQWNIFSLLGEVEKNQALSGE